MTVVVLAFGIAREVFGADHARIEFSPERVTVNELRRRLEEAFPGMKKLASYMIAVNDEYASGDDQIRESDEVAVIPPVSGG